MRAIDQGDRHRSLPRQATCQQLADPVGNLTILRGAMLPAGAVAAVALHDFIDIIVAALFLHRCACGQRGEKHRRERHFHWCKHHGHWAPFSGGAPSPCGCGSACLGVARESGDVCTFASESTPTGVAAPCGPTTTRGDSSASGFEGSRAAGRAGALEPQPVTTAKSASAAATGVKALFRMGAIASAFLGDIARPPLEVCLDQTAISSSIASEACASEPL